MAEGLDWLPEDGGVLTRSDLERVFVDLCALIDGTDALDASRAHVVDIAITITHALERDSGRRMMAKPKAIEWLEDQTGQTIHYVAEPSSSRERHLSVRLSDDLATGLGELAEERNITVSQVVRQVLADAVAQRQAVASLDAQALAERLAADVAEVRRRLAG